MQRVIFTKHDFRASREDDMLQLRSMLTEEGSKVQENSTSLQTILKKWLAGNQKRQRLARWTFERWVHPRLKKQCALRRSLFVTHRRISMLHKLACKEYANKKVIKVETVVDFFGNVCSYKPTMGGLQIRILDKSQAKRCEQYASFV